MLKIENLYKTFNRGTPQEQRGLSGLSLHLRPGEFVTVLGGNGAGKSTLFSAIAGSIDVDRGSILLAGENITRQKEHLRARQIGRLFQDPLTGTAPGLTIEENLALVYAKATGRFALGRALRPADRAYFREILASLDMGLENRLKTKAGLLSGGQRQALTLMIATMVPPKLLLLDEHTAALDPLTAAKVTQLTADICRRHQITTLMITHDVAAALKLGQRTIMMEQGQIIMDWTGAQRQAMTPGDLLHQYQKKTGRETLDDRMLFSGKEESI